jgi:trehalose synthase-fused probable maltokinase
MSPSETELLEFVTSQRWFGAKGRDANGATVLDRAALGLGLEVLFVEIRYATGNHDVYQLAVSAGGGDLEEAELLSHPELAKALLSLMAAGGSVAGEGGELDFCSRGGLGGPIARARRIDTEQSNSSFVLDDRLILKLYRRLEAGVSPELELLRFLAAHEFSNVPELEGWWSYSGPLMSATLGIVQQFVPDALDGWTLALRDLPVDPDLFLARVGRLGEVIGALHAVLASDTDDPAFAPEEASPEMLALLRATVDDEIEQIFEHLPESESVAPIAGCSGAVRDLLGELANVGSIGKVIRHHGDLHLGQVLRSEGDWFVVDFEGEPARSLSERRVKRSPLRDVAGMLRSFAYVSHVAGCDESVQERARELFLEGYLGIVEGTGILPQSYQVERLIGIFELEKAVYELRYELFHRPDWVHIPVAGIESLLSKAAT